MPDLVLKFRCPDHPGIIAGVSGALFALGADIRDAAQFGDAETGLFFARIHVETAEMDAQTLSAALAPVTQEHGLQMDIHDLGRPVKLMIAVSQHGHCLNDLLLRWHSGTLPGEIVGVVSNHQNFREVVQWYGLPFHYLPVQADRKAEQEQALEQCFADSDAELLVLARYMQVLSPPLCERLAGRCINIHHSFLPSFTGARPYHRAHARGVKLIGATAHYVTADLDEGPIIEQDVRRVNHATTPEQMVDIGREIEASVLARAVRWHLEQRVEIDGAKTVVFA